MPDIAALIETATDTSEGSFRRRMAVADLARSKEPRAIETLLALLDDNAYSVRYAAERSLEQILGNPATKETSQPAPLGPAAAIPALQPLGAIVTAELSTPSSSDWLATPVHEAASPPARAPSKRNWEAAKRFRIVFGAATTELRDLYDALSEAETERLESERDYHVVLERLGNEESANRDGLARLEHELDEATKELAELQREENRNRRKQHKLAREASTASFQIAGAVSSTRTHRR